MCMEYIDVLHGLFEDRKPYFPIPKATIHIRNNWPKSNVSIRNSSDEIIAGFDVNRETGLVWICRAYVAANYQGRGIGKWLCQLRVDAMKKLRAMEPCATEHLDMLCRANKNNEKEISILASCGWQRLTDTIWEVPCAN